MPATGVKVAVQVWPLSGDLKSMRQITVPLVLKKSEPITVTRASQADQPAINAQRVCPVTGKLLGSMGAPIKVSRGNQAVLLCCPGCVAKVQAIPDTFLGRELKVSKPTQADQKAIAAQKVCPITGEDLESMGMPIKISDGDRSVFVCCRGCLAKVQADPGKYLTASVPTPSSTTKTQTDRAP